MANARQAPAYLMEVRFTLEFQPDEEKSIVNSILEVLNIQADDCDVNHVVFPTAWTVGFAGRVWIDEIPLRASCKETRFYFLTQLFGLCFVFMFYFKTKTETLTFLGTHVSHVDFVFVRVSTQG